MPLPAMELQVAAFIAGRVAELQRQGQSCAAWFMRPVIDMPVIMAAFAAVIDCVLESFRETREVKAVGLRIQPCALILCDAPVEPCGIPGHVLDPGGAGDARFFRPRVLSRRRPPAPPSSAPGRRHSASMAIQLGRREGILPDDEGLVSKACLIMHGSSIDGEQGTGVAQPASISRAGKPLRERSNFAAPTARLAASRGR